MERGENWYLKEQHRAEMLLPTGRAIYCENCHEPIKDEEANFNWHTEMAGSPIRIQKTYCYDCIEEVIQYRYKMRNVAEMTGGLVKAFERQAYNDASFKVMPFRNVKHI